jgi:hypothetical protein
MTPADYLAYLRARGAAAEAEGDRLRVRAAKGVLTAEDREYLATNKAELVRLLTPPPVDPEEAWANQCRPLVDLALADLRTIRDAGRITIWLLSEATKLRGEPVKPDYAVNVGRALGLWVEQQDTRIRKLALTLTALGVDEGAVAGLIGTALARPRRFA